MPILTTSLNFTDDDKPTLLSAYSLGYILTQIGGGFLADRYGAEVVISATVGISSLVLLTLTTWLTSAATWTKAFLVLGIVAGPLFPAGSAAISANVPPQRRAASAAIVDAAASAGTTMASIAPMIADQFGWKLVYNVTAIGLGIVSVGALSIPKEGRKQTMTQLPQSNSNAKPVGKYPVAALFAPAALATYICHSADNFTKYSVNAWTATMLSEKHGASLTTVGAILATQEAIGVISRLLIGMLGPATASFSQRGWTSVVAFAIQGLALLAAFRAPSALYASIMFNISAVAVGAHSVGFRPIYFEASPEHAGSVSGFGNTIASLASFVGPVLIGSIHRGWNCVGFVLSFVALMGAIAANIIARSGKKSKR